jgi:hypothetical protein
MPIVNSGSSPALWKFSGFYAAACMATKMTNSIFISYGHADMKETPWVEHLRFYLMQNRHDGGLEMWDDSKIDPGSSWRKSIATALNSAEAAILLVGPAFLGSEFIRTEELPQLLSAARRLNKPLFPLIVRYCSYRASILQSIQAFNDPEQPLESLSVVEQNRIMNKLAIAINESVEKRTTGARSRAGMGGEISVVQFIQRHLSDTRTAFVAQALRRDELVDSIETKTGTKIELEYEKFFFKYYSQLTPHERFVFDQIRAITEGPLYRGNRAIVELLESHSDLLNDIPALVDLRQHLVFWLNKFDLVFTKRPEMCLLYTGVEDAVPFPGGIDHELGRWLAEKSRA